MPVVARTRGTAAEGVEEERLLRLLLGNDAAANGEDAGEQSYLW